MTVAHTRPSVTPQASKITPDQAGNCDYQINGEQTVPGSPEEVRDGMGMGVPCKAWLEAGRARLP